MRNTNSQPPISQFPSSSPIPDQTLGKSRLRKGQLGSRKSNDGCITCKIRKVKCDELRPNCKRCSTTGRKCDGYAQDSIVGIRQPRSNVTIVRSKHLMTYANIEPIEVQAFEFFIRRVLPGSSRVVDEQFWRQLIPQLSHSDPIIWNAIIALSCLIQYPQYSRALMTPKNQKFSITNEEHRRALIWYGKSIAGLRKEMTQATTRSATTVISCILYICIECLQDNLAEAISLFERAVGMMGIRSEGDCKSSPIGQLEESIERAIGGLLQNMSASHRLPIKQGVILNQSVTTFQSLFDAREKLFDLIFASHTFHVQTMKITFKQAKDWKPSAELISQQTNLQTSFLNWHTALQNMINRPGSISNKTDEESYSLLLVVYAHYYIMLSTCLSMYEIVFDEFFPTFQIVIDHASRIIALGSQEQRPMFTFETRLIPSLFQLAIKCRHPTLRRQAISLLRTGTQIENTWKADTMADFAEWVVGVEESGNIQGVFSPEPHTIELPPETNRLCQERVIEIQDSEGKSSNFLQFGMWQQDDSEEWCLVEHTVKV